MYCLHDDNNFSKDSDTLIAHLHASFKIQFKKC